MFLKTIKLKKDQIPDYSEYPFSIPFIRHMNELDVDVPVTFFVGENGAGKSTLLEAIADQIGFNPAGGSTQNYKAYEVHEAESALGEFVKLSWWPKVTNGFFLRAETFYQFASHLDETDMNGYKAYGGKSLHHQSHGESFFSLFQHRFTEQAIYLLDEPEAALSPARQLAFLTLLNDLVKEGNVQFIIATHSPILLGFPNAVIYQFDEHGIEQVEYEQTEHYQITSYFLKHREKMLKELFEEDED
ncbi:MULTISPECIES: AAA family ATPase [Solibacillus]|uniref:AAA family ATPase n=1 Tax=Solibacillus merdavium TaxID=2762218 RepID=A0ABR8XNA6_9BACL|nr:AAA family ATPase [Solibacillus merdavium]MBD8033412.1 AAA family ATPase [Solibacillus merdavium]